MSTATQGAPVDPQGAEPQGDALDELHNALADEPQPADQGAPEEWKPPTREEYDELVRAREAAEGKLKRARTQAQRLREAGKGAPAAAPAEGAEPGADLAPEVDRWKGAAIRQAAKASLLARGADSDMVDLALARLRGTEIEVDADGEPELEEWLDEMEERYPKLFAKPAASSGARPAGGVDQGRAASRPAPRQLSLGEQIIANSETARAAQSRRR